MRFLPAIQLFDLETDPGETTNVKSKHPQVVKTLSILLQSYVDRGRSTPGPKQKNDGTIDIWKAGKASHSFVPQKRKK
tara:strand:+ start:57 stop:290 length:234 start_codon:yes stop_codon:yes gene_type:complete